MLGPQATLGAPTKSMSCKYSTITAIDSDGRSVDLTISPRKIDYLLSLALVTRTACRGEVGRQMPSYPMSHRPQAGRRGAERSLTAANVTRLSAPTCSSHLFPPRDVKRSFLQSLECRPPNGLRQSSRRVPGFAYI